MLKNEDIERLEVINGKRVNIYIYQDSLQKYIDVFNSSYSKPTTKGPHFTFITNSIETFERNLSLAQETNTRKIIPEYTDDSNIIGEIIITSLPFILIIIIVIIYFVPIFVAKKKKDFYPIALINIFLGWTLLGWVAALIWSIKSPIKRKTYTYICIKCDYEYKIEQSIKLFICPNCKTENIIGKE